MATDLSATTPHDGQPPTTAHKTIGTLNVVFASVMLLCGACSGFSAIMQVAMAPLSEGYQKQMFDAVKARQEAEHKAKIAALQAEEDAAATEAEKAEIAARRQAVAKKPPVEVPMADMTSMYRDPKLVGFLVADFATGVVANIALFISGIGLLAAKSWVRRLGIWVAAAKIARLVMVYGFALIFVVPAFSQRMGEMVEKMSAQVQQQPGGPPMPDMGRTIATVYGVMFSSGAVLMMIGGSIYPIIMLWVLTRPKVRAACGEVVPLNSAESL